MKKGIIKIVAGILLGLGGFAAFFVFFFTSIMGLIDTDAPQYRSPGVFPLTLEKAGSYTLWHDYVTFHGGKSVHVDQTLPDGFEFILKHTASDKTVILDWSGMNMTTTAPNLERVGLAHFEISEPGEYQLEIMSEESRIFTITEGGSQEFFKVLTGAFAGMAALMLLGLLCLGLIIWGIVDFLQNAGRKAPAVPVP